MMLAAARALAATSPALTNPSASLLPPLSDIRRVAAEIAVVVGLEAQNEELAPKMTEEKLRQRVVAARWTRAYPSFASTQI
jgi:malate dehydrogenase (oxaloacetate-decarboxylating)